MTKDSPKTLKDAVIGFYRDELRRRYQLENVRRFDAFAEISDEQIVALRDFFMERIYPPMKEREQLDKAFENLGLLLRSPRRLGPLMSTALSSLWRFGPRLPSAISAGKATADAYRETNKLERFLVAEANRLGLKPKDASNRGKMVQCISGVPEKDVKRLIYDILSLFRALSNVKLLATTLEIMEQCHQVMEARPETYDESERKGVSMGLEVLGGGYALFEHASEEDLKQVIVGIEQVELDWYDRIREEAKAAAA